MSEPVAAVSSQFQTVPPYETVCRGLNTTMSAQTATGARRFIRIARPDRTLASIDAELALVDDIADTPCLAVVRALSGLDGVRILPIELDGAPRYATVYPAAPGEPPACTPENHYLAGHALRDLHQQRVHDHELTPQPAAEHLLEACAVRAPQYREAFQLLEARNAELSRLAAPDRARWPVGQCHGDFRLGNTHLHESRIWLFDWENCHVGHIWKDAARIVWWLMHLESGDGGTCWHAFLKGYMPEGAPQYFDAAMRHFMMAHEIESLHSLIVHHTLAPDLLAHVVDRALALAGRLTAPGPLFKGQD